MGQFNKTLEELEATLANVGLTLFGVVQLGPEGSFGKFKEWLDEGGHAGMEYMSSYLEVRKDSSKVFAGAKTAIVIGLNYNQEDKISDVKQGPLVAQYARLRDYHKLLKTKGEEILKLLLDSYDGDASGKVIVDTAPVLERALASRTKSGFVGKNTLFIHPKLGSFFLLSEIVTTIEIPIDDANEVDPSVRGEEGGCGSCQRCQINCPTGALDKPYTLDANKCISYWTIEHRGLIPKEYWPHVGKYVFGCDICQLVCPYNRTAKQDANLHEIRRIEKRPNLYNMAVMNQSEYEKMFGGTPMTRAKRGGLMRNALIAMHVTNNSNYAAAVSRLAEIDAPQVVIDTIKDIEDS